MKKRNAFTLIEILVVLVIIGMLIWVLFDIYITISKITFRVELQKNVNEELLFVTDTLQNLSNRNSIDYSGYATSPEEVSNYNLFTNKGIVDRLYLSWEDGSLFVYSSGCDSSWEYCKLFMNKNWSVIQLTQDKVLLKNTKFKIIPFEDEDSYNCELQDKTNAYECRNNPWFWFITQMYSTWYDQERRTHNVYIDVQQFFNN